MPRLISFKFIISDYKKYPDAWATNFYAQSENVP